MKRFLLLIGGYLMLATIVSCQNETDGDTTTSRKTVPGNLVVSETKTIAPVQEEVESQPAKANGLLEMANKILEQQSESGSENAKKAKDWMSDKFGQASESGNQIADDASKWATEAFESLKGKGLTSADNASQWLTEDIRNMNALKYKIVRISMADLDAVEEQLNELGKLRWDCFHAVEKDGDTILFFKKERRSILKNIPVRDMLKLVPLMGSEGAE